MCVIVLTFNNHSRLFSKRTIERNRNKKREKHPLFTAEEHEVNNGWFIVRFRWVTQSEPKLAATSFFRPSFWMITFNDWCLFIYSESSTVIIQWSTKVKSVNLPSHARKTSPMSTHCNKARLLRNACFRDIRF